MYKVVNAFRDAKDEDRFYSVGAEYPVEGVKPNKTRINELKSKNRFGIAFIEEVKEAPEDKETQKDAEPEDKETQKDAEPEDKGALDLDGLLDDGSDENIDPAAE